MILDGLSVAPTGAPGSPRRRRIRIGWGQAAAQLLFVVAVAAFVLALPPYGGVVVPKSQGGWLRPPGADLLAILAYARLVPPRRGLLIQVPSTLPHRSIGASLHRASASLPRDIA